MTPRIEPPNRSPAVSARTALLASALLAGLCLILGTLTLATGPIGLFHDDGLYVVSAKSIAEGKEYRLLSLPGSPPSTKYPPLFPLALALLWRLGPGFPTVLAWMTTFVMLCGATWLVLTQRLAQRHFRVPPPVALGLTALLLLSEPFLSTFRWVLAEAPFALAMTGVLLLADSASGQARRAAFTELAVGLLAGACFLIKTHALAVGAAILLAPLFDRRLRDALLRALGFLPAPFLWALWTQANDQPQVEPLIRYYLSYSSSLPRVASLDDLASLARMVTVNLEYAASSVTRILAPLESRTATLLGLLLSLFALHGAWRAWRLGARSTVLTVLGLFGLAIGIPWHPFRHLLAIVPLGFFLALSSLSSLYVHLRGSLLSRRLDRRWLSVPVLVAGFALGGLQLLRLSSSLASTRPDGVPGYGVFDDGSPAWQGFLETARYLKSSTPRDAVVASAYDPLYYLYSERKGVRFWAHRPATFFYGTGTTSNPDVGSPAELAAWLRALQVEWFIREPGISLTFREGQAADELAERFLEAGPARARLVFTSRDGAHRVYRLHW